jgi:hypothetical protein
MLVAKVYHISAVTLKHLYFEHSCIILAAFGVALTNNFWELSTVRSTCRRAACRQLLFALVKAFRPDKLRYTLGVSVDFYRHQFGSTYRVA